MPQSIASAPVDPSPDSEQSPKPTHVIGIGASGGGLAALQGLFDTLPTYSNIAIVVVQHLSPDFKSLMDDLLGRCTNMPVRIVQDGMVIEPGTVYLNVPRKDLDIKNGTFALLECDEERGFPHPIDVLFRALAREYGLAATAIVLSGTGSDGANGLDEVHRAGGLTIIQDPDDAEFDGMPRVAISACPNCDVAPVAEMEALIANHLGYDGDSSGQMAHERILRLLQRKFEIDFSHYKISTVKRRIDRRVEFAHLDGLESYVARLQKDGDELEALYRDLLIGVTRFLRDEEAFSTLEQFVLPDLSVRDRTLRAWIAGCATGEEAYSLAILFDELVEQRDDLDEFSIFATDIHHGSLATAGAGIYGDQALEALSERRKQRYFDAVDGGYRITKNLRRCLIFAPHNVLADAPFTNIDIVSCRNLLIYFDVEAQRRALNNFHYALNHKGCLFLGPSESLGEMACEFGEHNRRWRIFEKLRDVRLRPSKGAPTTPTPIQPVTPQPSKATAHSFVRESQPVMEAYDALLSRLGHCGFLLSADKELLHTFGDAGAFLIPQRGRPTAQLLDFLEGELRTVVSAMLIRSQKEEAIVDHPNLAFSQGEVTHLLDIQIEHLRSPTGTGYFLVSISESPGARPHVQLTGERRESDNQKRGDYLELELTRLRQHLQVVTEQGEASNEELQATNEEMVASNEELQSTNEELQSVNEELYTVNAEYQCKIQELSELNADMDHLLASTEVATIFLDEDLRLRRYTPAVETLVNVMPQDVGRPIDHLSLQLEYPQMMSDAKLVLQSGERQEREVEHTNGTWYLARCLPYRSSKSPVDGVVLAFVDISATKASQLEAEKKEQDLRLIMEQVNDGYWDWDIGPDGQGSDD